MVEVKTPWGPIGYITAKRTYMRKLDEDDKNSPTEEFPQAVERVISATDTQLSCGFSSAEKQELREILLSLKGSVAGRFWWQLGTKTVDQLGLFSLQNCAFTVVDHPIDPFCWAFDALMLGAGVGYNIQREFVYEIPKPKPDVVIVRKDVKDAEFIVPDSREGWVQLLHKVLEAHYYTGEGFSYSTVCIRGKGAPIKGFGGTASGPEELCWGIDQISKLLNSRADKKVRPIDCLDIMNIIGFIVVAGNVRRSAQIAIGDCDDRQFLQAKRWDLGSIPNWRAMSNNSVVCNNITQLLPEFWEGYKGNGEPYGLINLRLSKEVGRLNEYNYSDLLVKGFNPCAEQSLADKETCCLAEIPLPLVSSFDEFLKILRYLYIICKHSLRLPCHQKATKDIVHAQMRMGIGITGQCQATEEQLSWLSPAYVLLRELDTTYSAEKGWPASVKLTTVKPSGTLSLLSGVTPGAHPGYSQYFIRRVRIAADSNLVDVCRKHGYPVEFQKNLDGSVDHKTVVVEFPCAFPEHTKFAKDMTAVDQLENVKWLQTNWSDNSVSCTIYYRREELPAIQEWLKDNYNNNVKTCSFLLHNEHGFHQAPYEEITKEEYDKRIKASTPITGIEIAEDDVELEECAGGACPIK